MPPPDTDSYLCNHVCFGSFENSDPSIVQPAFASSEDNEKSKNLNSEVLVSEAIKGLNDGKSEFGVSAEIKQPQNLITGGRASPISSFAACKICCNARLWWMPWDRGRLCRVPPYEPQSHNDGEIDCVIPVFDPSGNRRAAARREFTSRRSLFILQM